MKSEDVDIIPSATDIKADCNDSNIQHDKHSKSCEVMVEMAEKNNDDGNIEKISMPRPRMFENASLMSYLTMTIFNPLLAKGALKPLNADDVDELSRKDDIEYLVAKFNRCWRHRRETCDDNTIVYTLLMVFGGRCALSALCLALHLSLMTINPIIVKLYITNLAYEDIDTTRGIMLASILVASIITSAILISQAFFHSTRCGAGARATLMSVIYAKSLRNASSLQQLSVGETVNLMSNDARRLHEASIFCNFAWLGPIQISVVIFILYLEVGWAAFAGLALLLCVAPIQGLAVRRISKIRAAMLKHSDQRIKLTNEALRGIRIIKIYAWEKPLAMKINELRQRETHQLSRLLYLKALNVTFLFVIPIFVSATVLLAYERMGNELTLTRVVSVFAILNSIRFPMAVLPAALHSLAEAKVAITRMSAYLLNADITSYVVSNDNLNNLQHSGRIEVINCSFRWNLNSPAPVLRNVSLNVKPGSFVAIVGLVGSGKSSLLSALIGEMHLHKEDLNSHVMCSGRIAYMSQTNWIRNQTLRDNILFGLPYNATRYEAVLHASALHVDVCMLPAGDATEIGERGINLSGGQKARVAYARALYRRELCEIYMLDDPFSAVDLGVGKRMFEEGLMTFLSGTTRIVTLNSHLHFLKRADRIVVMQSDSSANSIAAIFDEYNEFVSAYPSLVPHNDDHNHGRNDVADVNDDTSSETHDDDDDIDIIVKKKHGETTLNSNVMDAVIQNTAVSSGVLMQQEHREHGSVRTRLYSNYLDFAAPSHPCLAAIFVVAMYIFAQICRQGADLWVTIWGSGEVWNDKSSWFWSGIYISWGVAAVICASVLGLKFANLAISASRNLHNQLFEGLLRAPTTTFYDITPLGRIINRFSKDLDVVDITLPDILAQFIQLFFSLVGSAIFACTASPYVIIVIAPLFVVFLRTQRYFRQTSRELKRIEGLTRSPVFASFEESLSGVATIRAFGAQNTFKHNMNQTIARHCKIFLTNQLSGRWLAIRLDLLSSLVIAATGILPLVFGITDNVFVSIGIIYAMQLSGLLQYTVRISVEVESSMTAVERLAEYTHIETEAPSFVADHEPDTTWPQYGAIKIRKLSLRYRPTLPLVLKNISCDILAGEKIGVCGRTGAGKSSLALALLRLVECESESCIEIDGVNVAVIGLETLRRRIGVIPQDAVLFSGSVRFNIDPFEEHSDDRIWHVLNNVHLASVIEKLPHQLQHFVTENGTNFSYGQRQLICIARAFLKDCRIIITDEATAGIDSETDSLIQATIRTLFVERTVITIAHRLQSIVDSDRIMVLSEGELCEFDAPNVLLRNKESAFYEMVQSSGASEVALQLINSQTSL